MEIQIQTQALTLTLSFAMGMSLGIFYDMLRPPRRKMGRASAAVLDAIYCLFSGFIIFCFAMGADKGRLGTWELAAALIGFLVYMHTLSTHFLCLFTKLLDKLSLGIERTKKTLKKSTQLLKLYFQKLRE